MKVFNLISSILLSVVIVLHVNAGDEQNTRKYSKLPLGKKYKLAQKLMKDGGYITAAQYLEEYIAKKPTKHKAVYMAAKANQILRDYSRSADFYSKLLEIKPEKYPMAQFDYGMMLKMSGKYDEAKKAFSTFSNEYDGSNSDAYISWAKKEMEGCDFAAVAGKNPNEKQKVEHLPLPVNNELTEFAPKWLSKDKILYSSFAHDTAIDLTTFLKNKKDYRSKIYTATNNGDSYNSPMLVEGAVNDPKFHNGNAIISADGNTMYFTRCNEDEALNMICKIYTSKKSGDSKWGEPTELSINIDEKNVTSTQPALGKDANGNDVLYFISNRSGGQGGLDIWFATMDKSGTLSAPKNLGKTINTIGDEWSPFYDAENNKLYFSSNGHKNMGGFDVFVVKGTPDKWDTIANMGAPINSSADDIYLALDPKGEEGYMISNRPGTISPRGATCCDDIFYVYLGGKKIYIKGYYASKEDPSKTPISGVENTLYEDNKGAFEYVNKSVSVGVNPFVYELKPGAKYKINGSKEGYYPGVDNFEAPAKIKSMSDTIFQVFLLEPIKRNKVKVENVYFVFDKSGLDKENSTLKIDSIANFLKAYASYGLEIAGHTDSKGSDEYNNALSKKRAQAVAEYLISKQNISKDRIIVKGLGESQPIAPNEFPDGRDNPEGRAKNRRVEFKLITDDKKDIEIIYDTNGPSSVE